MQTKNYFPISKFLIILITTVLINTISYAQLTDWRYEMPMTITNNAGAQLTNYQVLIELNTSALVNAGYMRPDGNDIRFASNCGSGLIDYCLENYMNTDSTKIWVKIASLAPYASINIYLFMGNPSASSASNLSIFEGPYSSTNYVSVNNTNSSSNTQRGFRFAPNRNILVTHFGKRIPNATPRYVTLFDYNTHAIISQMQVSPGTPGSYNYNQLAQPQWLENGRRYVIELFQGPGDSYYFGTSSQIGAYLTFYDMRYCNNCTQNTFPTSSVPGVHYGVPDFLYYVRQTPVNPEPSYSTGLVADTNTPAPPANLYVVAGNQQAFLYWNKNTEFDIYRYLIFMNTVDNRNTAAQIGYTIHPDTTYTVSGLLNNTPYYFWVKAVDRYCSARISDYSNVGLYVPLSIQNEEQLPKKFELYQNYPNPFNPVTDIKYDVPKESFVKMTIYDLLGREVDVIINETKKAGRYTAKWNPENLPSGIYIYNMTAGDFEKTMKMVLLK